MAESVLQFEALPDLLPIFPLGGVLLLPRGRLPLNIFEPRYLAMTEDALADSRLIGMIQPLTAPGGAAPQALHRIGCVGRLTSSKQTEDGRYLVTLAGVIRFGVAEELPMVRGYRRVRADYSCFAGDLAVPDASITTPGLNRSALFAVLRGYFAKHNAKADWPALEQMADVALVETLATGCPFAPVEQQALLEAPDFAARAATLVALLHMDTHDGGADHPPRRPS